jgi:hypothetical protein
VLQERAAIRHKCSPLRDNRVPKLPERSLALGTFEGLIVGCKNESQLEIGHFHSLTLPHPDFCHYNIKGVKLSFSSA